MTETPIKSGELELGKVKHDEIDVIALQYAEYLHVDSNQQIQHFDNSIEELLTKLDEYHGLLDMIRSDTSLCLQKNLPLIKAKNTEMEKMFYRIDKLEAFVAVVKKNVSKMEDQVDKAEADLGSFSTIRKVFSSIPLPSFFGAKKTSPVKTVPQYTASDIFKTKDFIKPSQRSNKKHDSNSLKAEPSHLESGEPVQKNIPSIVDQSSHVDGTSVQTDQSNASNDSHNIPDRVNQSEAASSDTLSQSDSGFQSPMHLNENNDVRSKTDTVQS